MGHEVCETSELSSQRTCWRPYFLWIGIPSATSLQAITTSECLPSIDASLYLPLCKQKSEGVGEWESWEKWLATMGRRVFRALPTARFVDQFHHVRRPCVQHARAPIQLASISGLSAHSEHRFPGITKWVLTIPKQKRLGRGRSSGLGKTSGRGHKGQKARSGNGKPKAGFEGGQTTISKLFPKKGFTNSYVGYLFVVSLTRRLG